jgi:hypothetical protein
VTSAGAAVLAGVDAGRLRRIGAGLVAFGVVGLILVASAVVMLLAAGPSIDELGSVSDRTGPTREALDDASRTLDDLARSADSLEATLGSSQGSLTDAAEASRSLADALAGLSSAMSVEILGSRPFAGVGDRLDTAATGVRRVADDLAALAGRLGGHAGDAHRVATDAAALRDSVDSIDASLGGPPGVGLAGGLAVVRLVLIGLLAWLGVLAFGCVLVGRRLRARGGALEAAP